jgi:hypothetical protein
LATTLLGLVVSVLGLGSMRISANFVGSKFDDDDATGNDEDDVPFRNDGNDRDVNDVAFGTFSDALI